MIGRRSGPVFRRGTRIHRLHWLHAVRDLDAFSEFDVSAHAARTTVSMRSLHEAGRCRVGPSNMAAPVIVRRYYIWDRERARGLSR